MNLLITGAWNQAADYINEMESKGHKVKFMQYEKDEIPCPYEWVEGVVCNGLFLHHPIERFVNLTYIQLISAGFDRVPMEYVKEHGIQIHNARGVYSIPMAEFAIASVLQLYKQMDYFRENQREHRWNKHRGLLELHGKNVCVIGCGSVGTECAKRFLAFGCNVIGVDLYPSEDENYTEMFQIDELNNVISQADVVVLTLPLTDETTHLMNRERFALLKQGAMLVNIARGAVVDTEALIEHLDVLGGVVLDVFEQEPLQQDSLLWNHEKVIVTPHNSFVGDNNLYRLNKVIMDNLNKMGGSAGCIHIQCKNF